MKFLSASLLALAAGCGDNLPAQEQPDAAVPVDADLAPRAVTVTFTPKVGTAAFACGQTYEHMGAEDTTITPRDFRFYVSDVELIGAGNVRTKLALDQDGTWQYQNVALLDFENFTGGCADGTPETNVTLRGKVPPGTYTGIAFTIGIPEELNHKNLTTLPAPLNLSGLSWDWMFGHIFFAAVTHTEITTPTPGTNDHYFHVGSTGCSGDPATGGTVVCTNSNRPHIEVTGFDPLTKAISVDYGVVIAGSLLTSSQGCHSFPGGDCAAGFTRVGLDFTTGNAGTTAQTVFSAP